ncbi:hypothetical protein VTK26DRAFT_5559 [Humicola hyalothermophila]
MLLKTWRCIGYTAGLLNGSACTDLFVYLFVWFLFLSTAAASSGHDDGVCQAGGWTCGRLPMLCPWDLVTLGLRRAETKPALPSFSCFRTYNQLYINHCSIDEEASDHHLVSPPRQVSSTARAMFLITVWPPSSPLALRIPLRSTSGSIPWPQQFVPMSNMPLAPSRPHGCAPLTRARPHPCPGREWPIAGLLSAESNGEPWAPTPTPCPLSVSSQEERLQGNGDWLGVDPKRGRGVFGRLRAVFGTYVFEWFMEMSV